jgi:molybdopterin biosynthesis enzyme MoaB
MIIKSFTQEIPFPQRTLLNVVKNGFVLILHRGLTGGGKEGGSSDMAEQRVPHEVPGLGGGFRKVFASTGFTSRRVRNIDRGGGGVI